MMPIKTLTAAITLLTLLTLALPPAFSDTSTEDETAHEDHLIQKAHQYYDAGRPELIIEMLEPEAIKQPNNKDIAYYLFASYTAIGLFEQGEKWLRRVIKINDNLDSSMLAVLYYLKGNKAKALEMLRTLPAKTQQKTKSFHYNLGMLAASLGEFSAADEHFSQYDQLTDKPLLNLHHAMALKELGQTEQARQIIKTKEDTMKALLTKEPDHADALYVLGEVQALRANANQSARYLKQAVGKQLSFHFYYAVSDEHIGDPMWAQVRHHPAFIELLREKKQQMTAAVNYLKKTSIDTTGD